MNNVLKLQREVNTISKIPQINILNKLPPDITKLLISVRTITTLIFTQTKYPIVIGLNY